MNCTQMYVVNFQKNGVANCTYMGVKNNIKKKRRSQLAHVHCAHIQYNLLIPFWIPVSHPNPYFY